MHNAPMPVPPIEKPRGFFMTLLYLATRLRFGTVLTPVKVLYARNLRLLFSGQSVGSTIDKLSLEPSLRRLVQVQVSRVNGCVWCADFALAHAVRDRIGAEKFNALSDFQTSSAFTERERAALLFADEATRYRQIAPETWQRVKAAFNDTEIVELVWLNAAENFFNLQNAILGIDSDQLANRG